MMAKQNGYIFMKLKAMRIISFQLSPPLKQGFPEQMMHSEEEAYQNAVLYITKPGTYTLKGSWHGQINIDLGEDAFNDETQKVTLILDGANIECTVAPGIVFTNVYECDNEWEDRETNTYIADTKDAGAKIILADGSENTVSGTNIFRILKTQYKDDESKDEYPAQKKRLKTDGALYSYQSLNIEGAENGSGILNIISGFEGLNSELHLSVNGGNVNIFSQDDGINVNEDGVSVLTVNGGTVHICAGLGAEGDGVDSNGFLCINGGTVISSANPASDSGLDSDNGSYVFGGTVVSLGSSMDWATSDESVQAKQAILNMRFLSSQNSDEAIIITDLNNNVVFAYDPDKDEAAGTQLRSYSGAIISCEKLSKGSSYKIYIGGEIEGKETNGVYDVSTITSFKDAALQCYSGNNIGGMGGMGGNRPNGNFGMNGGEIPQMPNGNMQKPQGQKNDFNADDFNNRDFRKGGMFGGVDAGALSGATCTYNAEFALNETVNAFSSVTDYRHDLQQTNGVYVCSSCGKAYKDAEGTQPASSPIVLKDPLWVHALFFAAGAAIASAIFTVILIVKRKKAKK